MQGMVEIKEGCRVGIYGYLPQVITSMEEHGEVVAGLYVDVRDLGGWGLSPNIFRWISRMASGALTGFFAFAGAFIGALSGALAGQASDTDILRGAAMGAITGAVLAIEFLEASSAYWLSDQSRSRNNSMVREIYGDFATKGLPRDLLKKLPSFVKPDIRIDGYEESICCTICLQDIVGGETARRLPLCFHTFHLSCVDKWLVVHSACPMCRQYVKI